MDRHFQGRRLACHQQRAQVVRVVVSGGAYDRGQIVLSDGTDQSVGGAIVADRDHQGGQRVQRDRRPVGPILADARGMGFGPQLHDV